MRTCDNGCDDVSNKNLTITEECAVTEKFNEDGPVRSLSGNGFQIGLQLSESIFSALKSSTYDLLHIKKPNTVLIVCKQVSKEWFRLRVAIHFNLYT